MLVRDFDETRQVDDEEALEVAMSVRYGEAINSFSLSHGNQSYPRMLVLVNQELANVHYFPEARHPGYQSAQTVPALEHGGGRDFYIDHPSERVFIVNEAIIFFEDALRAAKEFLRTSQRPESLDWLSN